uniref:Uncharacterized LOC107309861 n=1 Tax=Coturnix japonica TaxID=93934 RepID=A0A8C2T1D2_COTJA
MEITDPAPELGASLPTCGFPFSLAGGDAQAAPVQSPAERTLVAGSSVSMTCQLSSDNTVHWYRQLRGEPPKRILYMSGYSPTFDKSIDRMKFQAQKNPSNCVLTIKKATQRDTGTYYCIFSSLK